VREKRALSFLSWKESWREETGRKGFSTQDLIEDQTLPAQSWQCDGCRHRFLVTRAVHYET
jgi:hypothetical protein